MRIKCQFFSILVILSSLCTSGCRSWLSMDSLQRSHYLTRN
jgi:hypothetical protein